jgi:hypothetical protein
MYELLDYSSAETLRPGGIERFEGFISKALYLKSSH